MSNPRKPTVSKLFQLMGVPSEPHVLVRFSWEDLRYCEADWDAVARHLESHPEEAAVPLPCWGDDCYPLAAAVKNESSRVPPNVVTALLQACPVESIYEGRCPLLTAVYNEHATSIEVWKLLLDRLDPVEIVEKGLLLSCVNKHPTKLEHIRAVIEASPGSLVDVDRNFDEPLNVALRGNAPLATVRLLIEEGVKHQVGGRYGAGGLLCTREDDDDDDYDSGSNAPKENLSALQHAIEEASETGANTDENRRDVYLECFKVAGSAKTQLDNEEQYPPIHWAIQCAPLNATIDLIDTRVQDFHTAVDPLGRTPLHVAMVTAGCALEGGQPNILKDSAEWKHFLQHYLIGRDNGNAARTRDKNGNLPLNDAIENNLTVDHGLGLVVQAYPEAAACCDANGQLPLHVAIKKGRLTREDGLDSIMSACPRAAICRDAKTGMYPFMLAGFAPNPNIDTIYMMLREDPAAVCGGIRPPAQELYLIRKHEEERAEWQRKETEYQRKETEYQRKESEYQREIESLKEELAWYTDSYDEDPEAQKRPRKS